jgi:hypothetical protein
MKKDEKGVRCKNTSARAAGIAQSKWTLKELLIFSVSKHQSHYLTTKSIAI